MRTWAKDYVQIHVCQFCISSTKMFQFGISKNVQVLRHSVHVSHNTELKEGKRRRECKR